MSARESSHKLHSGRIGPFGHGMEEAKYLYVKSDVSPSRLRICKIQNVLSVENSEKKNLFSHIKNHERKHMVTQVN